MSLQIKRLARVAFKKETPTATRCRALQLYLQGNSFSQIAGTMNVCEHAAIHFPCVVPEFAELRVLGVNSENGIFEKKFSAPN